MVCWWVPVHCGSLLVPNTPGGTYSFCFILISGGCLTSPTYYYFFLFATSQFDWLIAKKQLKLWRLPQNRRLCRKMEHTVLWPIYIGEKGRAFGKTCGIKVRCYWEHLEEHIGNLMGTRWELKGNMLETKEKRKKILPPPPSPAATKT